MNQNSVAIIQTCSVKKMLLKITQNSQENTCARVSFLIKMASVKNPKKDFSQENNSNNKTGQQFRAILCFCNFVQKFSKIRFHSAKKNFKKNHLGPIWEVVCCKIPIQRFCQYILPSLIHAENQKNRHFLGNQNMFEVDEKEKTGSMVFVQRF